MDIRALWIIPSTALVLLAPLVASAATPLGAEQVTSISQFSDLRPTDWAYQALTNLVEKYGCVAGYPNGSFRGGQAMTRFEAAALLNACLDRVTEVTDTLKRLMAEFAQELAVLKGRTDGLEAKAGQIEASQFSTTTKLSGLATFVVGGVSNN
ncbi:MAG: iron uptake porin, partial [Cyanobacteria bacterium]|nr:iron uptake porin [Cyanobacteriota bacterium]